MGKDASALSDDEIKAMFAERARRSCLMRRPHGRGGGDHPGRVKADRWRILVGSDAQLMDRMVRDDAEHAYEEQFFARFAAAAGWHPGRLSWPFDRGLQR